MEDAIKRAFTQAESYAQFKRLWRARKFGDQTQCPQCDYSRKLWDTGTDQWMCPRCERKFRLFTKSRLSPTRFELPEILELLYWFKLTVTGHDIAEYPDVDYRRVHPF